MSKVHGPIQMRWLSPTYTTSAPPKLQWRHAVATDASGGLCPGNWSEWFDVPFEVENTRTSPAPAVEAGCAVCGRPVAFSDIQYKRIWWDGTNMRCQSICCACVTLPSPAPEQAVRECVWTPRIDTDWFKSACGEQFSITEEAVNKNCPGCGKKIRKVSV